jgi:hypothetical protein
MQNQNHKHHTNVLTAQGTIICTQEQTWQLLIGSKHKAKKTRHVAPTCLLTPRGLGPHATSQLPFATDVPAQVDLLWQKFRKRKNTLILKTD